MIRRNQNKKNSRLRRACKTRKRIEQSGVHRLSVYRSIKHMYVQLLTSNGNKVLTTVSTNEKNSKRNSKWKICKRMDERK